MTTNTVLVTGGTGKTGRRVAARLAALGIPARIGSRSAAPRFDWQDPAGWPAALDGVDAVYLAYAPDVAFPGGREAVAALARLAHESGVRRLVLLSGRGEPAAQAAEADVAATGAEWGVVRASFFAQNFSEGFLAEAVAAGVLPFPGGEVAEPFVDVEDLADLAVHALTAPRPWNRVVEATGPRLLTFAQAADEIGAAAGRPVAYVPLTVEEFVAGLLAEQVPADLAADLGALFAAVLDGRNASVADGVAEVLGRPARDFGDYARAAAATGVWGAPAPAGADR
jgi:uncharacterized protein YbjT (DUF2867 family)